MTDLDTGPSPLDHPTRRRGEVRLEAIANNALLKIVQFVITGVALPAIGFGINSMVTRLDRLEQKFIATDKDNATREMRLMAAEKTLSELSASHQTLRERLLSLEFQSRMKGPNP